MEGFVMFLHRVTPRALSPVYSDVVNTMGNLDYIKDDAPVPELIEEPTE